MSKKLTILVVEDDPSIKLDLEMILEGMGHTFVGAESAKEVFSCIENGFDLLIMDIFIKGELNGLQTAAKLAPLNIPIIFITAHKDKKLFEEAVNTNAIAFLVKPFDELTLRGIIEWQFPLFIKQTTLPVEEAASFFVKGTLFIKSNRSYHKVLTENILFVQSELNYIVLHTVKRKRYVLKKSLSAFKKEIKAATFLQIHKRYLVNLNQITQVDLINSQLYIDKDCLPIGRTYRKKLTTTLNLIG
ncbi:MAG: response regulator transcription factor [Bacteroidota bacterium]